MRCSIVTYLTLMTFSFYLALLEYVSECLDGWNQALLLQPSFAITSTEIQNDLLPYGSLGPTSHDPYGSKSTGNGSHHWYFYYPLAFQAEGVLLLPAFVRLSVRPSSHQWRNVWRDITGSRQNWAQDFTRTSQKNNRTSQKNYYQHSRNFWNFLFLLIIPITQASRCTTGWIDSGCWGADTS